MSELPEGWIETTIAQVSNNISYGYTASATQDTKGLKYLRITDIQNGFVNWETVPYCSIPENKISTYELKPGDLVFARTGATTGKSFLIESCPKSVFASYLIRVEPSSSVLPKFIACFFQSRAYWDQIIENISGSAQPNCNATKLSSLIFPLPPLAEQRRIVAKLETLLGKVDACQQRLAKIPLVLKRFRQAVLAAACSGQLTVDWRTENPGADAYQSPDLSKTLIDIELPPSWHSTKLGHLTTLVTSGSRGWAEYYADSGSIFIRAQNINSDFLNLDDIAYVALPDNSEGKRTKVSRYDLLTTITGANVTKSALVEISLDDAYVSQHVALVRLADQRLSKFIFYWILSIEHGRKQLQESAYGAGKPGLNLDNIREVSIAIPPLVEQQEIVRRVEAFFKLADQLEARYQKAKAQVDKLQQSILAKAFRGELVPTEAELARREGREYESAAALLARVREGKAAGTSSNSSRRAKR